MEFALRDAENHGQQTKRQTPQAKLFGFNAAKQNANRLPLQDTLQPSSPSSPQRLSSTRPVLASPGIDRLEKDFARNRGELIEAVTSLEQAETQRHADTLQQLVQHKNHRIEFLEDENIEKAQRVAALQRESAEIRKKLELIEEENPFRENVLSSLVSDQDFRKRRVQELEQRSSLCGKKGVFEEQLKEARRESMVGEKVLRHELDRFDNHRRRVTLLLQDIDRLQSIVSQLEHERDRTRSELQEALSNPRHGREASVFSGTFAEGEDDSMCAEDIEEYSDCASSPSSSFTDEDADHTILSMVAESISMNQEAMSKRRTRTETEKDDTGRKSDLCGVMVSDWTSPGGNRQWVHSYSRDFLDVSGGEDVAFFQEEGSEDDGVFLEEISNTIVTPLKSSRPPRPPPSSLRSSLTGSLDESDQQTLLQNYRQRLELAQQTINHRNLLISHLQEQLARLDPNHRFAPSSCSVSPLSSREELSSLSLSPSSSNSSMSSDRSESGGEQSFTKEQKERMSFSNLQYIRSESLVSFPSEPVPMIDQSPCPSRALFQRPSSKDNDNEEDDDDDDDDDEYDESFDDDANKIEVNTLVVPRVFPKDNAGEGKKKADESEKRPTIEVVDGDQQDPNTCASLNPSTVNNSNAKLFATRSTNKLFEDNWHIRPASPQALSPLSVSQHLRSVRASNLSSSPLVKKVLTGSDSHRSTSSSSSSSSGSPSYHTTKKLISPDRQSSKTISLKSSSSSSSSSSSALEVEQGKDKKSGSMLDQLRKRFISGSVSPKAFEKIKAPEAKSSKKKLGLFRKKL